ncbi:hypothetical protein V6N13_043189 [Hibiscus sabdariffa]
MLNHYSASRHSEIFITIWALWFARKKLVHENSTQGLLELVLFVTSYNAELRSSSSKLAHSNVRASVRWIPPSNSHVKINVDASFIPAESMSYSGLVIRDNEEFILGAAHRVSTHIRTAFEAEAMVICQGILFGEEIGCMNVIVEGDARSMIRKMLSLDVDASVI